MPFESPYIAILDIGHGNCTVLRDTDNVVIIDCGSRGSGLLEFLEQEEISVIEKLFLSHADQDHIGGLLSVLSSGNFTIQNILVNSDATKASDLWNDLTYELSLQNERGNIIFEVGISRKKELYSCGNISISITGPTPYLASKGVGGADKSGNIINSNSISASFHVFWNDRPLIFLAGDIDQIGLKDLMDHNADLKADLLVFPHHGGKSSNHDLEAFTETLCKCVNPKYVVFSIGRHKFDNPRPEVIQTVRKVVQNVRITCTELSMHCAKKIINFDQKHLSPLFARGREKNLCCGGTVIIKLGETIEFFPEAERQNAYIREATPSPMCFK